MASSDPNIRLQGGLWGASALDTYRAMQFLPRSVG
jgi:hypothetical protein